MFDFYRLRDFSNAGARVEIEGVIFSQHGFTYDEFGLGV